MTPNVVKDVGKEEQVLLLLEMQSDADTAKTNAEVPHYYRNRSTR